MRNKLLGIICLDSEVTDRLLIEYFVLAHITENGCTMDYISYLQT
jgi:hypothetical protein